MKMTMSMAKWLAMTGLEPAYYATGLEPAMFQIRGLMLNPRYATRCSTIELHGRWYSGRWPVVRRND